MRLADRIFETLNNLGALPKTVVRSKDEEQEMFQPPKGAVAAAKKAIEWKEKHGDEVQGGTQVGWTRAGQLSRGEKVSLDIVKRMHSFFSRHEGNQTVAADKQDTPWKDAGHVAWLIWGGDAAKSWAAGIAKKHSASESLNDFQTAVQKAKEGHYATAAGLFADLEKQEKNADKKRLLRKWMAASLSAVAGKDKGAIVDLIKNKEYL